MPRYNVQKRNTMDRITRKAVTASRRIIRSDMELRVRELFFDLNNGERTLQNVDTDRIKNPTDRLFEQHEFVSIRTGVSDGIQEVTPNNELGLWQLVPEDADPILTLPELRPLLGEQRDKITRAFITSKRKKQTFSLVGLRNLFLADYLSILRKGYRELSRDWIAGEDSIDDVTNMLGIVFGKTTNEATRIFRTETTNYFNTARAEYFQEFTDMDFMQIFAVTDGRISKICEDRHEWVFEMSKAQQRSKKPAFHPHCRTIQRPLTTRLESHRRLIDKGLAKNPSSFTPLPKGWG